MYSVLLLDVALCKLGLAAVLALRGTIESRMIKSGRQATLLFGLYLHLGEK